MPDAFVKLGNDDGKTIVAITMVIKVIITRELSRVSLKFSLPARVFPWVVLIWVAIEWSSGVVE
jgi:hypothetical protein